ncbi:unnamed protein product [Schistosoma mattheei]|uniref:Uncharacterized protein n=1 Tax=Schistosoma mattheei TaxID=31246 RepID=A0A3P8IF93_9TREM|nr:unnamed protein product [Schistosoma mattheei]
MSRDNPSVLVIKSSLETNRPKSTIGIRIVKQGIPGARNARIDGEYRSLHIQITGRRKTNGGLARLFRCCCRSVLDDKVFFAAFANSSTTTGIAPSISSMIKQHGLSFVP